MYSGRGGVNAKNNSKHTPPCSATEKEPRKTKKHESAVRSVLVPIESRRKVVHVRLDNKLLHVFIQIYTVHTYSTKN